MIEADVVARTAIVAVDETLLTPIIGHKGHPDVAVDLDDFVQVVWDDTCLLYTSPSPRDATLSRMPSSA